MARGKVGNTMKIEAENRVFSPCPRRSEGDKDICTQGCNWERRDATLVLVVQMVEETHQRAFWKHEQIIRAIPKQGKCVCWGGGQTFAFTYPLCMCATCVCVCISCWWGQLYFWPSRSNCCPASFPKKIK